MRDYGSFQTIGTRFYQCDAYAVRTSRDEHSTRAYVVIDGVGDHAWLPEWVQYTARRLAVRAAALGAAEAGLREMYEWFAEEPGRPDPYGILPNAAAVVAVRRPGGPLTVAWAGDCRAYLIRSSARLLTQDHNLRRVYPQTDAHDAGSRHQLTSYLGSTRTDQERLDRYRHPAIETVSVPDPDGTYLLLASDGAYEPHHEAGHPIVDYVYGFDRPQKAARHFVTTADEAARKVPGGVHADNATALVVYL